MKNPLRKKEMRVPSLAQEGLLEKEMATRKWQPTPVFLPEKPHGQRSLAGCGSWGPRARLD